MVPEFKHFKLANGDELVCEVMEWDDMETTDIVVRKALKLVQVDDIADGTRYFSFRPWMLLQDSVDNLQVLNGTHIVGEANPTQTMMEQYEYVLSELMKQDTVSAEVHIYEPDESTEDMDYDLEEEPQSHVIFH
jgi:hypothetical protein